MNAIGQLAPGAHGGFQLIAGIVREGEAVDLEAVAGEGDAGARLRRMGRNGPRHGPDRP